MSALVVILTLSMCTLVHAQDVPSPTDVRETTRERAKRLRARHELQRRTQTSARDWCYHAKIPDGREVYWCDFGHYEPEAFVGWECVPVSAAFLRPWSPWEMLMECREAV